MDRGQMILFGGAALFVAYQTFRGWQLGIVRQLIRLGALAAAYVGGYFFGEIAVPLLRLTGFPDVIVRPLSAVVIGIAAYLIVSFVGRVLFKKTTDQDFGLVWLVYGASGAVLGAVFGLISVTIFALALRVLGSLATGISGPVPEGVDQPAPPRQAAISGLAGIRQTLDTGIAGGVLDTVDPIPRKAYELTEKLGRLAASPAALQRFLTYPGVEELSRRPEIHALRDDPEIAAAVRDRRYLSLLRHPRLKKTANNPKLVEAVKGFDVEKALDFALETERSPSGFTPSSE